MFCEYRDKHRQSVQPLTVENHWLRGLTGLISEMEKRERRGTDFFEGGEKKIYKGFLNFFGTYSYYSKRD